MYLVFLIMFFITMFLLLRFIKNFMTHYIEHFDSELCKKSSKIYRPTCDKKKIYNILSNMETELAKIRFNMAREKTKTAGYDYDKMYTWYKNKLESEKNQEAKNKAAAAAYATQVNNQIDNDLAEYKKENKAKHDKKAKKAIAKAKPFSFK